MRWPENPLTLRGADVATLYGLVDLMDSAQAAAPRLPANVLVLNGRRDQVIPQAAIATAWAKFPASVRCALYLNGYHLLLRDLDRALVEADVLAWLANPQAWLPVGRRHQRRVLAGGPRLGPRTCRRPHLRECWRRRPGVAPGRSERRGPGRPATRAGAGIGGRFGCIRAMRDP